MSSTNTRQTTTHECRYGEHTLCKRGKVRTANGTLIAEIRCSCHCHDRDDER